MEVFPGNEAQLRLGLPRVSLLKRAAYEPNLWVLSYGLEISTPRSECEGAKVGAVRPDILNNWNIPVWEGGGEKLLPESACNYYPGHRSWALCSELGSQNCGCCLCTECSAGSQVASAITDLL